MAEFTLLKLQLEDASFTANAPFSDSDEGESGHDEAGEAGGGGDGRRLLPLLVGLAFLLALAVAVRKLRGGDGDD